MLTSLRSCSSEYTQCTKTCLIPRSPTSPSRAPAWSATMPSPPEGGFGLIPVTADA